MQCFCSVGSWSSVRVFSLHSCYCDKIYIVFPILAVFKGTVQGMKCIHVVVQLSPPSSPGLSHLPKLKLCPHWTLAPRSPQPLAPPTQLSVSEPDPLVPRRSGILQDLPFCDWPVSPHTVSLTVPHAAACQALYFLSCGLAFSVLGKGVAWTQWLRVESRPFRRGGKGAGAGGKEWSPGLADGLEGPKRWGVQGEGGAAWGDVQVQVMDGGGEGRYR